MMTHDDDEEENCRSASIDLFVKPDEQGNGGNQCDENKNLFPSFSSKTFSSNEIVQMKKTSTEIFTRWY